jgi:nucleoside-diphosphate kinase
LKLIDYADDTTRKLLENADERTVCVLSPALYDSMGGVIEMVESEGYTLADLKSTTLMDAEDLEVAAALMNVELSELARPEPLVVASFRGANVVKGVRKIVSSSSYASMGAVCPNDAEEVTQFVNFFLKNRPTTATFEECTCCVIKPRAITERMVGPIIDNIASRGFVVTAIQTFRMERAASAEFLEVYDGVVPEYKEMVNEMCSGPVIALELRLNPTISLSSGEDHVVDVFRSHAGPWDEMMAKEIAPESIRGMFGNVIHCTDLPKDGAIEVEYFFSILAGAHYIDGWK